MSTARATLPRSIAVHAILATYTLIALFPVIVIVVNSFKSRKTIFREPLEAARGTQRDPRKGGRPAYDAILMFKILVLREMYALSDEQVEYVIKTVKRSLGA